jgi:hypothetical protein
MATQDNIVGLLTGTPQGRINPLVRPKNEAQRGGRGLARLFLRATGNKDKIELDPYEKLENMLPDLDQDNPDDLTELAKLQQTVGNLGGASATIARRNAILKRKADAEAALKQARVRGEALKSIIAEDSRVYNDNIKSSMFKLVDSGLIQGAEDIDKFLKETEFKNVFNQKTGAMETVLVGKTSGEILTKIGVSEIPDNTETFDIVDSETGVTNKVIFKKGTNERVGVLGQVKPATIEVVNNNDGTFSLVNKSAKVPRVVGTFGTKDEAESEIANQEFVHSELSRLDGLLGTISKAETLAEEGATGVDFGLLSDSTVGDIFSGSIITGESPYRELNGYISTIKANLAFDRLSEMRRKSKTGGALGQVSNIELELLKNSISALDGNLQKEPFLRKLKEVRKHYENFKKALLGELPDINYRDPSYEKYIVTIEGKDYLQFPNQKLYEIID